MTIAKIEAQADFNMPEIASLAGQNDPDKIYYAKGCLHVRDVTQEALDQALSNYDHGAFLQSAQDTQYVFDRKDAYPEIGAQLDAIWKQLNYDRMQGRQLIQEADDLLNEVLAVKAKYPKPTKEEKQ